MSELLRKLAHQLRAAEVERQKTAGEKCVQIIRAATGLQVLRGKLGGSNVA